MKNKNLNLKIKRLPYSRLLKSEMADYVEKTIEIVESLNSRNGGFVCEIVKWYRPEYKEENVLASVKGFNRYRNF